MAFAGKRQLHQIGAGHLQRLPGDELQYFVNFWAVRQRAGRLHTYYAAPLLLTGRLE